MVRTLVVATVLTIAGTAAALAEPMMFKGSAWVCDTPEHYQDAVAQQQNGGDLATLRHELRAAGRCLFVEDEDQDDILAPFVSLMEEHEGMAKVAFMIQDERRRSIVDRSVSQTRYLGWTEAGRLQSREAWRKFGN